MPKSVRSGTSRSHGKQGAGIIIQTLTSDGLVTLTASHCGPIVLYRWELWLPPQGLANPAGLDAGGPYVCQG